MVVTILVHLPFAAAMRWFGGWLAVAHADFWAWAVALAPPLLFWLRMPRVAFDRAASGWRFYVLDGPMFAHWCAALGSAIPVAVCLIVNRAVAFLRGHESETLGLVAVGTYGLMLGLSVWGIFVRRHWVRVREVEVHLPGLAPELDGYRIVQLSDLHIGSVTPAEIAEKWVRLANEARPDLIAVTGDLIARGDDYHADVARLVAALRAPDGVYVVMGNHDYFGDAEALVSLLRRSGACVLRNEGAVISRGGGRLHVAGVDDRWTDRTDVARALSDRPLGAPTVLLAHDPWVFRSAARLGADLVLAGHTHGGQVAFPFLARKISLSSLTHRHRLGLYREGKSALYVHPGLGTTGPPIRLGVAPEVTVLVLRCPNAEVVASVTTCDEEEEGDGRALAPIGTDTSVRGAPV